jgi:LacI family transcriptional regulator
VIQAVQEEATERGYGIVLAVSSETAALEQQHIERLLAMHVDGLLVSVSKEAPDLDIYKRVRDLKVPLVFFDRQVKGLGFSSVTVDDRGGAERGVTHLIEQGYREIAHIAGTNEAEIGRERRAGFEAAMRAHDLPVRDEWVIEGGFSEAHGYEAFLQILETGEIPEAIFAVTFPAGLGLWGAIRDHRPDLAESMPICTFGQGNASEFYTYPHICVRQPTQVMGHRALNLLLDEIEGKADGTDGRAPQQVVLDTEVVLSSAHVAIPS